MGTIWANILFLVVFVAVFCCCCFGFLFFFVVLFFETRFLCVALEAVLELVL